MIDGVTNADAIPVLERVMQFASQRHRLIAHNIANISTPGFRPVDVSVDAFREQLADAVDQRRKASGADRHQLRLTDSRQLSFHETGIELHPEPLGDNVLFHDQNDRSVEHTMQDLVENFMTFRTAAEMLRGQFNLIQTAIRERL